MNRHVVHTEGYLASMMIFGMYDIPTKMSCRSAVTIPLTSSLTEVYLERVYLTEGYLAEGYLDR